MSKQQQDEKILEGIGEYKYGFHDRDDITRQIREGIKPRSCGKYLAHES